MHAIYTAIIILAAALVGLTQAAEPTPPPQPTEGPGGSAYIHARVATTRLGAGTSEVYLFEPADPAPRSAPVVVFVHGWAGMDPNYYGSWLTHNIRPDCRYKATVPSVTAMLR